LLLWWKIPWSEFCHGGFGWLSHGFSHSFALFFCFLCCMLNVLFYFLTEMQGSVVNFFFSLSQDVRGGWRSQGGSLNSFWNLKWKNWH
jgi:hypothetical protein